MEALMEALNVKIVILSMNFCTFGPDLCPNYCPGNATLVTRDDWQAGPYQTTERLKCYPAPTVVVHHTDTRECSDLKSCGAIVRSIQNYHVKERKWDDIGYNFLIGGDGNIYEGRGYDKQGSHAKPYNEQSIGIAFIGNFSQTEPSQVMIDAFDKLVCAGRHDAKLYAEGYQIIGHRQASATECPGEKLYDLIKTWKNYAVNGSALKKRCGTWRRYPRPITQV